jgi:heat shock protein HspQ
MVKKIKINTINSLTNIFFKTFYVLCIVILCILILYGIYTGLKKITYFYRLKQDFNALKNMGINVKNYNLLYVEENKKKHIMNQTKLKNKNNNFKNKNSIGFIPDKYVILDIDTKDGVESADFLIDKIPKDTVSEKTPNGYHFYFENDTGKPIHTYVQLVINDVKYSVDILGIDSLVTMSPTCINGKDYYWINSIFTHKPAKLSDNAWITDLIHNNKPFNRKFDGVNMSLNIKNAFIIIDNLNIESQFRFLFGMLKEYSKKIKFLNGVVYVYDDNYYFLTKSCFSKYKNKNFLFNKLKNIIQELSPSYIVDLNMIYSNYFKPESIIQLSSAIIDNNYKNYKNNNMFKDYIKITNNEKKTKYLINDTVTINDLNNPFVKKMIDGIFIESDEYDKSYVKNKILMCSESIYLTMMLSNYFNIPGLCLGIVSNNSHKQEIQKIVNTFLSLF